MLRVCLFLTVQSPDRERRKKYIKNYITIGGSSENKMIIKQMMANLDIDLDSPDVGEMEDEEYDEEVEQQEKEEQYDRCNFGQINDEQLE